jgi:hypothetical protein
LNPVGQSELYTSDETLRARYREVLRLREHVERLERLRDAAERRVIPFPPQGRRDRSGASDRAM